MNDGGVILQRVKTQMRCRVFAALFFTESLASHILARPDDNSYARARALTVFDNGRLVYSGLSQQQY